MLVCLLPGHPRRGRGQVRVPSPSSRVGRGHQSDGDVIFNSVTVWVCGVRSGERACNFYSCTTLLRLAGVGPRRRHGRRGCVVQISRVAGSCPALLPSPFPRNVCAHNGFWMFASHPQYCVHRVAITLIIPPHRCAPLEMLPSAVSRASCQTVELLLSC